MSKWEYDFFAHSDCSVVMHIYICGWKRWKENQGNRVIKILWAYRIRCSCMVLIWRQAKEFGGAFPHGMSNPESCWEILLQATCSLVWLLRWIIKHSVLVMSCLCVAACCVVVFVWACYLDTSPFLNTCTNVMMYKYFKTLLCCFESFMFFF